MTHQSQLFDEEDGKLVPNPDVFHESVVGDVTGREHPVHVIRDTSRESYRDLLSHPLEVSGRHREYLDALRGLGHAATDQEVSRFAGHSDPNYFRPRRNELVKMGLVVESGKRVCSVSGKTALVWWVVE
jgi:hypothetical protein